MSLMRSFSHGIFKGIDEIPAECWNLFTDLVNTEDQQQMDYCYEIISTYLNGSLREREKFNLKGYAYGIKKKEQLNYDKRKNKLLFLDDNSFDDNGGKGTAGYTMSTDLVVQNQTTVEEYADVFDELLNSYELRYAVETIEELKEDIFIEENIDIIECVRQAMRGLPSAVQALKGICAEYELLGEQIKLVLASGVSFHELFGLTAATGVR